MTALKSNQINYLHQSCYNTEKSTLSTQSKAYKVQWNIYKCKLVLIFQKENRKELFNIFLKKKFYCNVWSAVISSGDPKFLQHVTWTSI